MKMIRQLLLLAVLPIFLTACKDKGPQIPIPTSYTFDNVDYSDATTRMDMFKEMMDYIRTGNRGNPLDIKVISDMYRHKAGANDFRNAELNASNLNVFSKTSHANGVDDLMEDLMEDAAIASQSVDQRGSSGQAGIVVSVENPGRQYLLNENGVEYAELIEKSLMGSFLLYQAAIAHFGDIAEDDNKTIVPDQGTEAEHNFDEAFGYFGVQKTFPRSLSGIRYWSVESQGRNEYLETNQFMMDNFLAGRAAISNKDDELRDKSIGELLKMWERIAGASAIHYLNIARTTYDDVTVRCHQLSLAAGLVYSSQFVPTANLSLADRNSVLTDIGGTSDLRKLNFYNTTTSDIDNAIDELAKTYSLKNIKDEL